MKSFLQLSTVLTLFICFSISVSAQRSNTNRAFAANTGASTQEQQAWFSAAKAGDQKVGMLLPAVQAFVEPSTHRGPSLSQITKAYRNQCAILIRTKGKLSKTQLKNMEIKFEKLNKDLDLLVAQYNRSRPGNLSGGSKLGSQFSDCYNDCHSSFPGTGGGSGANRFACKFGCFLEAAGGGN